MDDLFGESDLPLFSQTAQHSKVQKFEPKPVVKNLSMFNCPICRDTGQVRIGKKIITCFCKKGETNEGAIQGKQSK